LQIAYRKIVRDLLPENLYPLKNELHIVLEEYLDENAENYVNTIGRNAWISLFSEKLYPEVCKHYIYCKELRRFFILLFFYSFR
jgi:hypothetical protein